MLLLFYRGSVAASDFNLAATEGADSFSATVQAGDALALAATEQADTFAATMVAGQAMALAATEAADTFAGELAAVSSDFNLAATEAPDVFAGTIASVGSSSSSGVSRLAKSRAERFVPQQRVVGLFFRPPPTPKQIEPSGGGQYVKPPPPPEVASLFDIDIERHARMLERRVSLVEQKMADAALTIERRMAKVALLERKKAELDAVRDELKIRRIKRDIEAEDEMIITALLAA